MDCGLLNNERRRPAHVVAAWIGHSVKVQRDSYAQITDGHFEKFNSHPTTNAKSGTPGGTQDTRKDENGQKVAHPVAHSEAVKTLKTPKNAGFFEVSSSGGGIRNSDKNAGKTASASEGGAKSGAVSIQSGAPWAEIRALIESCPDLSPAARRQLITLGDRGQR